MPTVAANSSEALKDPFRQFLRAPSHDGLFLHMTEEGVDLLVQVVGEAPARFAADCTACGHRSRFQRLPQGKAPTCALCREALTDVQPARDGEKHCEFAWRVAWAKDGFEGLCMGRTIEEGRFTDDAVISGVADVHGVLRVYLPLFEDLNLTTMQDYRAFTRLNAGALAERVTVRHRD